MSQHPLARYGLVLGVCVLAGAVSGGVSAVLSARSGPADAGVAAGIALSTGLAMAIGLWTCGRWWRGLDEAAQEAHKWAWWWGSTFGLAIGGVALLTLILGGNTLAGGQPQDWLLAGAGLVVGAQTVGYGIAWAVWWLRRQ